MHEAGHAVAVRHLLKKNATPVVFNDEWGAAYHTGGTEVIATTDEAVMIAAGGAAEALVRPNLPPSLPPAPPLTTTYPELANDLLNDIKATGLSDDVRLARWVIRGIEGRPYRWVRTYELLMDKTDMFIRENSDEIVRVARDLYTQGMIRLPAEPAGKDQDHVD
jgi:hypothetical protein